MEFADESKDEVYWELEKFLKLALKANPNVLETLWTPLVLHADEVAQRLRERSRSPLLPKSAIGRRSIDLWWTAAWDGFEIRPTSDRTGLEDGRGQMDRTDHQ